MSQRRANRRPKRCQGDNRQSSLSALCAGDFHRGETERRSRHGMRHRMAAEINTPPGMRACLRRSAPTDHHRKTRHHHPRGVFRKRKRIRIVFLSCAILGASHVYRSLSAGLPREKSHRSCQRFCASRISFFARAMFPQLFTRVDPGFFNAL